MRTPDTKPNGGSDAIQDPKQRIGRALTRAYKPILEEPVPPTLAKMAERLDPADAKAAPPGLVERARRAIAALRKLIVDTLGRS
jgi:hypothetical protein